MWCQAENCRVRPTFGYNDSHRQKVRCSTHKLDKMINLNLKICKIEKCISKAVYNHVGLKDGLYCFDHKLETMVNVKDKLCRWNGCPKRPFYNYQHEKVGIYCSEHKTHNMINLRVKICSVEDCDYPAGYKSRGEKVGTHCVFHKTDQMIEVGVKACRSTGCQKDGDKDRKGYCYYCFYALSSDQRVARQHKKEKAVTESVISAFPDLKWVIDETVFGGSSRRRPDLLLNLGRWFLIVEIDEHQHKDYSKLSETRRLLDIREDLRSRPFVLLRFNPDEYQKNGENITSCWGEENGVYQVKKNKQEEWKLRLDRLHTLIRYWLANGIPADTSKTIFTTKLFFDRVETRV